MKYMTKRIRLTCDNIKKANDKDFVFKTFDNMIDALYDFESVTSNLRFDKTNNSFIIMVTLKISKTADMLWVLLKEYMSLLRESENNINMSITEIDEGSDTGITYKIFSYVPVEEDK